MRKKLLTWLLALGCMVSAGALTACDGLPFFGKDTGESTFSSEGQGNGTGEICPEDEHVFTYKLGYATKEGYYTLSKICGRCKTVEFSKDLPQEDCEVVQLEATCTEMGGIRYICRDGNVTYKWIEHVVSPLQHDLTERWSVEDGKNLCEDGGACLVYCQREGCDYAEDPKGIAPIGHHSLRWTVDKTPTATETGALRGVCNGCDVVVNGIPYEGCGKEVEMALPELNNADYEIVIPKEGNCTEAGKETYRIVVDGQSFDFETAVSARYHKMATSDGDAREIVAGATIFANDSALVGGWTLLNGEEVSCDEGAYGVFICVDCATPVAVCVKAEHTKPTDESQIQFTPSENSDTHDEIQYTCVECGQEITEALQHSYIYTIEGESDGSFTIKTTCANRFNDEKCPYSESEKGTLARQEQVKESTCNENGQIKHTYVTEDGQEIAFYVSIERSAHSIKGYNFFEGDRMELWKAEHIGIKAVDDGRKEPVCSSKANVLGVGVCEQCGEIVGVSLFAEHTPSADTTKPTCETQVEYVCSICNEDAVLPPLGHEIGYTYVGETADEMTFQAKCSREGCGYIETKTYSRSLCDVEALLEPTCEKEGSMRVFVFVDEAHTTIEGVIKSVIPKTSHTLTVNGGIRLIEENVVYAYDVDTMTLISNEGGVPNCTDKEGVQATFTCEVCETPKLLIFVTLPHVKPSDEGSIVKVAPSCDKQGYDEWTCTLCSEPKCKDNFVAAVGHDVIYGELTLPTNTSVGYVEISCKKGCPMRQRVELPTLLNSCYAVVKIEAACEKPESTEYTISAREMEELAVSQGIYGIRATDLKFSVTTGEALSHQLTGNPLVWTDKEIEGSNENTYEYKGYFCARCDTIIIVEVELISSTPIQS